MAKYAQVHEATGFVVNLIEWDGNVETWRPPAGYTMIEVTEANGAAGPGWTYADGVFTPPPGGEPGAPEEAT